MGVTATGQFRGGTPHRCEICGKQSTVVPSDPPGDAVCPHCGVLIWPKKSWGKAVALRENDRGRTYLCEHLPTGRRLQLFVPHRRVEGALANRLREEARLLSKVRHPNLVRVRGAVYRSGRVSIVSDYTAGDTLRNRLKRLQTISISDAVHVAILCSDALAALHQHSYVHRLSLIHI